MSGGSRAARTPKRPRSARRSWEVYLDELAAFGMRPGLERVAALLEALGRPQERFRVVHVVGTNGKSSTTRYTAALIQAHGRRAGAYLSPHITDYCERVLVDGEPISPEAFGTAVERVRREVARLPVGLGDTTQFEVLTVAALVAFAESGVEAVALEAGLGGRLDATNITVAPVVVLTNIALEHTAVLGGTRAAIFAEKAAVIKGGDAVFGPLGGLEGEAEEVCARAGARAHLLGRDFTIEGEPGAFAVHAAGAHYTALAVPSPAPYQVTNAGLAVLAAHLLLGGLDEARLRAALKRTVVRGRLQVVARAPLVLADGAHNPAGMEALAAALRGIELPRPVVVAAAVMRDKDVAGMLAALLPLADVMVCTQASEPRSLAAGELADAVRAAERVRDTTTGVRQEPLRVLTEADPGRALASARELAGPAGTVVVTGSLYLLEDLAAALGVAGSAPRA